MSHNSGLCYETSIYHSNLTKSRIDSLFFDFGLVVSDIKSIICGVILYL